MTVPVTKEESDKSLAKKSQTGASVEGRVSSQSNVESSIGDSSNTNTAAKKHSSFPEIIVPRMSKRMRTANLLILLEQERSSSLPLKSPSPPFKSHPLSKNLGKPRQPNLKAKENSGNQIFARLRDAADTEGMRDIVVYTIMLFRQESCQ